MRIPAATSLRRVETELGNSESRQVVVGRQWRVPWTRNGKASHTGLNGGGHFTEIIAEEKPPSWTNVWVVGEDLVIAFCFRFGSRIDSVEPVRDEWCQVRGLGVGVREEQLLCRHRARRVNHDLLSSSMDRLEEGMDIGEQRGANLARFVSLQPEMALE